MPTWINNGRTIGYSEAGTGSPILAFHGTTQSSDAWNQVQQQCTVPLNWITFEFPGSGSSDLPSEPIDLDSVIADARDLMRHLGHDTFHVVGYSLGAVAALRCAAMFPENVISVTSLCGWATTDARMRVTFDLWRRLISIDHELFMRYALTDGYTAEGIAALEPMFDVVVQMAAAAVQPGSDAQLELDIRIDIADSLKSITAPCLVIGGIEDRWVDISNSREIAQKVEGSVLLELPAGHLVIGELSQDIAIALSAHVSR